MNQMHRVAPSVLSAIGQTPLIRLDRICEELRVNGSILAKLDFLNPGGSKKDRAALELIDAAEKSGALVPGQTVIELTSGNMGTGLSIVCSVKGYPFIAVMSRGNSPERAVMMRALGAEVVLVDQAPGSKSGKVSGEDLDLVEIEVERLKAKHGAFRADQFRNFANVDAHAKTTGRELWFESEGSITAFCDFVGSGGTLAGVSETLHSMNSDIRCYAVEPSGAAALGAQPVEDPNHPIQGGGYAKPALDLLRKSKIDGFVQVTGDEAKHTARILARTEGVFTGFSSGANVAAAIKLLKGRELGGTIGVVLCDSGMKYISTDLWEI